jgi:cell division protein FtsQ
MNNKKYKAIVYSGAWMLLIMMLLVSMGFVNNSRKNAKCTGLNIIINSEEGNYFVDEDDIRDFIYKYNGDPIGQQMQSIDFEFMESEIEKMEIVRNAEVYSDLKGNLKIEIKQKSPIARLFFENGKSAYMDEKGNLMPLSSKFTTRVIVVNGKVPSQMDQKSDPATLNPLWTNLYNLINTMRDDPFLNAQFEQIYINNQREYELTPRVGRHSILLGKGDDFDKKFDKLKIFYKKGISKVDWNKYKQIDLRFNDQIVCSKR